MFNNNTTTSKGNVEPVPESPKFTSFVSKGSRGKTITGKFYKLQDQQHFCKKDCTILTLVGGHNVITKLYAFQIFTWAFILKWLFDSCKYFIFVELACDSFTIFARNLYHRATRIEENGI